jgi:PST family polysaccharide transporter
LNSITTISDKYFGRFLGTGESLRRQAIVGSHWLLTRGVVRSGLELIKTSIFARVLFPDDYGLMALATLGIGMLESVSGLGLEIKIQTEQGGDPGRLEAYWTLKALRGLLLFSLAWAAAPPLAEFYAKPELIPVVRFSGLTFVCDGFAGFGRELCHRQMEFSRVAWVDSVCLAIAVGVGLLFLCFNRNFWALAFYSVFTSFCLMAGSYAFFRWRPRFRFEGRLMKGVAGFSASILLVNVLNFLFNHLDKGVIGKLLSLEQLGLYARAYFLALLPVVYVFQAIAPVILNAFRRADNEPGRLRQAFAKTLMVFGALSLLIMGVFYFFGPVIVRLIYGERWLAILPALNVLILYGASKAVVSVCAPVFFIRRKTWMLTVASAAMVGAFAILCYPLTMAYGMVGAAWAVVVAGVGAHALGFSMSIFLLYRTYPSPAAAGMPAVEADAGECSERGGSTIPRAMPPSPVTAGHPTGKIA